MELIPIAYFYCDKIYPQDAPKQASIDQNLGEGEIRFKNENNFLQALDDLDGFSHLWIIYQFHLNSDWKPKVLPPRGSDIKRGVFATRSPYRPNPLGLSCVEIVRIEGLAIWVKNFDLLNETPIFDIKPYLPYADSFPQAKIGWLERSEQEKFKVEFTQECKAQLLFLEQNFVSEIKSFAINQLSFEPLNKKKKRLIDINQNRATLCYRTWRLHFLVEADRVNISKISSGYTSQELNSPDDLYNDKEIHLLFNRHFLAD